MRMFMGMLLGCLLTVGAVYIHDSMATSTVANGIPATTSNTIVNWDVAARKWVYVRDTARTAWVKLQGVNSPSS